MQQLERDGCRDGIVVRITAEGVVREQQQPRTDPLAAGARCADALPQDAIGGADGGRSSDAAGEEGIDGRVDCGERVPFAGDHLCISCDGSASLRPDISSSCLTSHGLNAHGESRADSASAAGSTHRASMASSGLHTGSPTTVAT